MAKDTDSVWVVFYNDPWEKFTIVRGVFASEKAAKDAAEAHRGRAGYHGDRPGRLDDIDGPFTINEWRVD